jgi:hypothetical protein
MTLLAMVTYRMPAVNSSRSLQEERRNVSLSSVSLRSSLKKQNSNKKRQAAGCRCHVQIVEDLNEEYEIEPVQDSWVKKKRLKQSCHRDCQYVNLISSVRDYICAHDVAFLELCSGGDKVSKGLQKILVQGAGNGYRGLERYSSSAIERKHARRLFVSSVVSKYGKLAMGSDWHKQLCIHSKKASRTSRKWAFFLGQIDAKAAVAEYATIPRALLIRPRKEVRNSRASARAYTGRL